MSTPPENSPRSFLVSASQIESEAKIAGAGRVCYVANGLRVFSSIDEDSISKLLRTEYPNKYKLQSMDEHGNWSDVRGYLRTFDVQGIIACLLPKNGTFVQIAEGNLEAFASIDPSRFHVTLRKILRIVNDKLAKKPDPKVVHTVYNYFDQFKSEVQDEWFRYFLETLSATAEALDNGLENALTFSSHRGSLEQPAVAVGGSSASIPEQIARANLAGKVSSLSSRAEASSHFSLMRELDTLGIVRDFYVDMGAYTYYSEEEVSSPGLSDISCHIRESIQQVHQSGGKNEMTVAVSVDANFFRIYSHLIYLYAQQLPHLDFTFLICGEREEVDGLIRDGEAYVQGLNQLNHMGVPSNINFFQLPVPDFVVEKKTFYACARFYAVQALLELYPRIYLMDIDLWFDDDPTAFFTRVKELAVAAPLNYGMTYLSPWRRYLAGNMPFNKTILETGFLEDLQGYVTHGLTSPNSWMLDQNALTYAMERNFPDGVAALNSYSSPISPPKFRAVWEKNYTNQ